MWLPPWLSIFADFGRSLALIHRVILGLDPGIRNLAAPADGVSILTAATASLP
jgi:hypothetical protein|tara:strand:+ start:16487 stop:16645 length:159 start_codon:yes stop_codon:yes gene_type:complete